MRFIDGYNNSGVSCVYNEDVFARVFVSTADYIVRTSWKYLCAHTCVQWRGAKDRISAGAVSSPVSSSASLTPSTSSLSTFPRCVNRKSKRTNTRTTTH